MSGGEGWQQIGGPDAAEYKKGGIFSPGARLFLLISISTATTPTIRQRHRTPAQLDDECLCIEKNSSKLPLLKTIITSAPFARLHDAMMT